jgi:perosamine synthetase
MMDVKETVAAIESVLPKRRPIEHHEPFVAKDVKINSGVTGYTHIKLMEAKLRELTDSYALLVGSGTAALELALRAAGIQPGDEVLVPALTFVGTANAVVHAGAIPNFIDGALNINPYKLRCYLERTTEQDPISNPLHMHRGRVNKRTERPIRALIVVHLLGNPARMQDLQDIADEYGLLLIEDAAEALGSTIDNRACGSFGSASIFSFNNNKIVTTGGGGAVLSKDEWIMAKAFQLATTARVTHPWLVEHDAIAWNHRMPNICAALGYSQLEQLEEMLQRKKLLNVNYEMALKDCRGVKFVRPPDGSNCWLNLMLVEDAKDRDFLLYALHEKGIKARALFTPMHKLPMYKSNPQDNMGYANDTFSKAVCLPSGAGLVQ